MEYSDQKIKFQNFKKVTGPLFLELNSLQDRWKENLNFEIFFSGHAPWTLEALIKRGYEWAIRTKK